MIIEIINMHEIKPSRAYDVYCDRFRGGVLGNHAGHGKGDRNEQIRVFREWFEIQLADRSLPMNPVRRRMNEIYKLAKLHGRLRLFCWCAPSACHTELIREKLLAVFP